MFGRRRSGYYSTRNYRSPVTTSFGRGYSRRSSATGRAIGSARASKSGSKLEYFNCNVVGSCSFLQGSGDFYSNVVSFYPCLGGVEPDTGIVRDDDNGYVYGGLVNDRSFRLRCAQYDEFRIVSMKVKINVENRSDDSFAMCSIIDRQADKDEVKYDPEAMSDINTDTPSFREVCESQGSVKTLINKNRVYPVTRSCFCRDIREKSDYTDCSVDYNKTARQSPVLTLAFGTMPLFTPAIYFCIKFNRTGTFSSPVTFGYTVEYNVIFRNPKSDLQTFIIKEDPAYENPASRNSDSRYSYVKSDDPYIPDMELKDGKETNISWWNRYLARFALRKAQRVQRLVVAPLPVGPVEPERGEEKKTEDLEDDA